jgi:hypothetical protein
MARIFVGGREIEVLEDRNGNIDVEQLRQAAGVPRHRALIRQTRSGENVVLPTHGRMTVNSYEHFLDAPRARRGSALNPGIIERDVRALSHRYPVGMDDDLHQIVVRNFNLPPGYNWETVPVLLEIPEDYPESPPGVGPSRLYVPRGLLYHGRKPEDYHEESGPSKSWAWWCYESIDWDPCRDNLITFFELLRAHMTNPI